MIKKTVLPFIKEQQLLHKGATVLVAVSGGPDSMALLHVYKELKQSWQLNVIALSVDHQFRGEESQEDLHFVKATAERWGIPFVSTTVDVPQYMDVYQLGTQIAARDVRYAFFKKQMTYFSADYLALGHHADDHVETVVMALANSAQSRALTGIPTKRPFAEGHIVRPFLSVTKEQILSYCTEQKIHTRHDPSNDETHYTRNYFRKKIVPLLYEQNKQLPYTLHHLSESLRADEQYLRSEAERAFQKEVLLLKNGQEGRISKESFQTYPEALQRRMFHLVLECLYKNNIPKQLTYKHEQLFLDILRGEQKNKQLNFPRKLVIEVSYDDIIFYFPDVVETYNYELRIPGKVELPGGSYVSAEVADEQSEETRETFIIHVTDNQLPLRVRTREPGDRMHVRGLAGSKKIKDIFIDDKIRRHHRETWPIVTDREGTILWLVSLRKCAVERIDNEQTTSIRLTYSRHNVQEDEDA